MKRAYIAIAAALLSLALAGCAFGGEAPAETPATAASITTTTTTTTAATTTATAETTTETTTEAAATSVETTTEPPAATAAETTATATESAETTSAPEETVITTTDVPTSASTTKQTSASTSATTTKQTTAATTVTTTKQTTASTSATTTASTAASTTVTTTAAATEATVIQVPPATADTGGAKFGEEVYQNEKAIIDASNKADGYLNIKYLEATESRLKVLITGASGETYTYDLSAGSYVTYPLSDGNGSYSVKVYRNTSGSKYAVVLSQTISVSLKDEFAPFLHANQYVNYTSKSKAVQIAASLTAGKSGTLEKITAIYDYVVTHISYDYEKSKTVKSGYLPDIDAVLASGKGICFDYAAVMTAMLRSQGIPAKLVVGYINDTAASMHAWISTYIPGTGWVNGIIFFDGKDWTLMDPTMAAGDPTTDVTKSYTYTQKWLY